MPLFLEIMPCFLGFSHLKPNETVKSSIVTLYMTFERTLKDFKVYYFAKTQVFPIAFAQVPTISQLYLKMQTGRKMTKTHQSGVG